MFQWHRLSQYHSLIEYNGAFTLIDRQRGSLGVYKFLRILCVSDLLWISTFAGQREEFCDSRKLKTGEWLYIEMTDECDVILLTEEEEEGKTTIRMRFEEWLQLLGTLREIEKRKDEIECKNEANELAQARPPPKELSYFFAKLMEFIYGVPMDLCYIYLCQDLSESQIEKFNRLTSINGGSQQGINHSLH